MTPPSNPTAPVERKAFYMLLTTVNALIGAAVIGAITMLIGHAVSIARLETKMEAICEIRKEVKEVKGLLYANLGWTIPGTDLDKDEGSN